MNYIKKNRWSILGGLVVTIFVLFLQLTPTPSVLQLLSRFDAIFYDTRLKMLAEGAADIDKKIKILDIDERSLKEEGRWPWSRTKIAKMIEQLADAGVKVVAFDVIFSEPELNSAEKLIVDLELRNTINDAQREQLSRLVSTVSNETYMAQTLEDTSDKIKVILGAVFLGGDYNVGRVGRPAANLPPNLADSVSVSYFPHYTGPMRVLQKSAAGVGFVNAFHDNDGQIRRSSLVVRNGIGLYPSLSLAAAMQYLNIPRVKPVFFQQGGELTPDGFKLGDYLIPTDQAGRMTIAYQAGAYSYDYISATDVIAGKYSGGQLQDTVVFVGTSASGLADLRSTPMSTNYPGVEAHAVMLESIFEQRVPFKPSWEVGVLFMLLLIMGVVLSFLQPALKPAWLMSLAGLVLCLLIGLNFYLWEQFLFDLTTFTPVLLVILVSLWNIGYSLIQENSQRQAIKSMFGQYVPPQHVELMLNDASNYNGEGESRELSVMFADIRGFTTISESLTAAELKNALNRFFTPITGAIFDNQGTIDKYVGDMVMAFWGAPISDTEHRKHAIDGGFAMLAATEALKAEFAADGLPEFKIGIGINSGPMNVGDMGSEYRRAYTVLGDSVNLGSRIESLTKYYGATFLVSEFAIEGVDDYVFLFTDNIIVKGKNEAIKVYQPIGLKSELSSQQMKQIDLVHRALDAYVKQDWDTAIQLFQGVSDYKYLRDLYIQRILSLQKEELGTDWDGVFRHTSK